MSRRRRNRRLVSLRDYALAGKARVVSPTTDSGYRAYGSSGRLFLPTSHPSNDISTGSQLHYASPWSTVPATGTIACLTTPLWASSDAITIVAYCAGLSLSTATPLAFIYYSDKNNTVCKVNNLATSADLVFASGSTHGFVGRWDAAGIYNNYDGADSAAGAVPTVGGAIDRIAIGCHPGGTADREAYGYVGSVIFSSSKKTDAWVTAIQADSRAAFRDPVRLFRDFCSSGDLLFPLRTDSTGYRKV